MGADRQVAIRHLARDVGQAPDRSGGPPGQDDGNAYGEEAAEADDEDGALAQRGDRSKHGCGIILGNHHPLQAIDHVIAADDVVALEIGESCAPKIARAGGLPCRAVLHLGGERAGLEQLGVARRLAHFVRVKDQPVLAVDCDDLASFVQLGDEEVDQDYWVEPGDHDRLHRSANVSNRFGDEPFDVIALLDRRRQDSLAGNGRAEPGLAGRIKTCAGPAVG